VLAWQARGHRFESGILHKLPSILSIGGFLIFGTIQGTKDFFGMSTTKELPAYKEAVLRDREGDLKKEWYIEYYPFDESKNQLIRKRIKVPQSLHSSNQRKAWANKKINAINALLVKGYHYPKKSVATDIPVSQDLTINQIFDLAIIKAASLRAKTQGTYKGILNKFREWLGERANKGLELIDKRTVSEYTDFLLSNDLTAVTINNQLNITRLMIGKVKKAEYIYINPFVYDKLTETESFSNVAFSDKHQKMIEEYLKENNYPLFIFTRIMYYNFIRPKELIELKIQDVDFVGCSLTVSGSVAKNRKTNTIPLHPILSMLIDEYSSFPGRFYLCGRHLKPGTYKAGQNAAYEAHREVLEKLNLTDYGYTLYSWRHTGAVRSYKAGTDIKTLQFLFRHASVTYTEIYLKTLKLNLKEIQFKSY